MEVCLYKHLVATKHHLGRVYYHVPDVNELYLKHWKNNVCDAGEERDADEFLYLDEEIYLKMFPYNKAMLEDKDEDDDTNEVEIVEVTGKKPAARSKGKAVEKDNKPVDKPKAKKGGELFRGPDFEEHF